MHLVLALSLAAVHSVSQSNLIALLIPGEMDKQMLNPVHQFKAGSSFTQLTGCKDTAHTHWLREERPQIVTD